MTTEAKQLAEEAITNGAEPAVDLVKNPFGLGKAISLSTELGLGFVGLALAAGAASFSINSFKAAYRVARS